MTYQPGIPTGFVPLNQDYLNLKNNFTALNNIFEVDHTPFTNTTPQAGYHTAIHLIPVSTTATNPPNNQPINGFTATAGYGQVLSAQINDGVNIDEALYFLTGGNRLLQLTRNFVPTTSANGATFLTGGIILNWGVQALTGSSSQTGLISFTQQYTATPYAVLCSLVSKVGGTGSSDNTIAVRQGSISTTQFRYDYNGNGGSYTFFYWIALGI